MNDGPEFFRQRTDTVLDEAHAIFRKWLSESYDCDVLDIVLSARASHELGGIPLWLMVIAGSGGAKTETVSSLGETGVTITSTIASEGALLSASPKKGRAKTATGGLLRKMGDSGVLILKDMTTILSMSSITRAPMLAALREIHDGIWERNVGTDGGQTLTWSGRITLIAACTSAWDEHHGVIAAMGDRFLLARFDSHENRHEKGLQALKNGGKEVEMHQALTGAVKAVIDRMATTRKEPNDAENEIILDIADAIAVIRTAVITNFRGDVEDGHSPEEPTRLSKQLAQVFTGALAIGCDRTRAMALVRRCGHDTTPPSRLAVLIDIEANPGSNVAEAAKRLCKPHNTVKRWIAALHVLGLLKPKDRPDGSVGYWLGNRLNKKGFEKLKGK